MEPQTPRLKVLLQFLFFFYFISSKDKKKIPAPGFPFLSPTSLYPLSLHTYGLYLYI